VAKDSFWDEHIPDEDDEFVLREEQQEYKELIKAEKQKLKQKRRADKLNEVGKHPGLPPEIIYRRNQYTKDYALVHQDLFPNSTGIKPYGEAQLDSIKHSQYFVQHGTHIVKCEPRGFAKTSRSTNEGLYGVLEGSIKYLVIVASSVEKAEEIISSIMAELMSNDHLYELFPRTLSCFRHTEKNPRKSLAQTYDGDPTYLYYSNGFIIFPYIPGEPSSGAIIDIRARKNVRGIYHTIETGEMAGTRQRPTHVILDDIQTDEEAENPNTAAKIVKLIKKSIMMAGGHDTGISIMMNGTPIADGDVIHHFLFNEPWQHKIYQMLPSRSEREDMWFGKYQEILLDFDKTVPGSRLEAEQKALAYYQENQEEMDKGAQAAWEWCYRWNTKIPVECSAIQHAYNIMILEGMDVFESECQCNVAATKLDETITYCTVEQIAQNIHPRPRFQPQLKDRHVVTHIDVNKPFLTYMTVSSPDVLQPQVIDYNSYPEYPIFPQKGKTAYTLKTAMEDLVGHELIAEDVTYYGVKTLVKRLSEMRYKREDGIEFPNHFILVDSKYHADWVYKAIRDSGVTNCHPIQGQKFGAKDKPLAKLSYSDAAKKYHHVALLPTDDRTLLRATNDIYYMWTQAHIAFSREPDTAGAASIYAPPEEAPYKHLVVGQHLRAERPVKEINPKTGKEVTIWEPTPGGGDNELGDNFIGCLAGLSMRGVTFKVQKDVKQGSSYDINDFFNGQK
jgi:hypothetical protein